MIDRRGLCRLLKYGAVAALFPSVASAQQRAATSAPNFQLAGLIGQTVLSAMRRYEQDTGKRASTVVIHFSGKLPTDSPQDLPIPDAASRDYTQLNQSHSIFSMKIEINPEKSH